MDFGDVFCESAIDFSEVLLCEADWREFYGCFAEPLRLRDSCGEAIVFEEIERRDGRFGGFEIFDDSGGGEVLHEDIEEGEGALDGGLVEGGGGIVDEDVYAIAGEY